VAPSTSLTEAYDETLSNNAFHLNLRLYLTVFAFGQTGAGKTHTISGSQGSTKSGEDGLVAAAIRYAYDSMASQATERAFSVKVGTDGQCSPRHRMPFHSRNERLIHCQPAPL
jgi:hypothetical protein